MKFEGRAATWHEAGRICRQSKGLDLVSIRDGASHDRMKVVAKEPKAVAAAAGRSFWIGANDCEVEVNAADTPGWTNGYGYGCAYSYGYGLKELLNGLVEELL